MALYDGLTNLYPVQKTLRWELKPVGKTLEYIHQRNLIDKDVHRSQSYLLVKDLIDRFHKALIEESLAADVIPEELLVKYDELVRNDSDADAMARLEAEHRQHIAKALLIRDIQ